MKLIVLFVVLSLAVVYAERNWSEIRTRVHPVFNSLTKSHGSRIVGGQEATPHQFKYQGAMFIDTAEGSFFCGGSLISPLHFLTAAHCTDGALSVEVILGAHNIRQNEANQQRFKTKDIKIHEQWDATNNINDISIVSLGKAAVLNEYVQLSILPRRSDESTSFVGVQATASGWGKDSDKAGAISNVLRFVTLEVVTKQICNRRYFGTIKDTHICTSGKGGKSTCGGDSGGPLVAEGKQLGVVSFGIILGCEVGWPAVFTRVSSYLSWIEANSDVKIQ